MLDGCSVVELRQYTLHDGTRERLIKLFEDEFIESQEALGIRVIGPFRDLEDSNRFVWLRGFPDMNERGRMLGAFYGGPVWQAHCDAANATMIDSDNVLLLRPTPGRAAESAVVNGLEMGAFRLRCTGCGEHSLRRSLGNQKLRSILRENHETRADEYWRTRDCGV